MTAPIRSIADIEVKAPENPEAELAMAVIERAILDLTSKKDKAMPISERAKRNQLEVWFSNRGPQGVYWWAEIAGICPERIRGRVGV